MEKTIEIPEGYEARIEGNKVIFEQKEDERIRKWLVEMVEELRKANPTNAEHNGNCSEAIAYLEKQKERNPAEGTVLQKAFINSKIDYTLEEKCDAVDYSEAILPTSVAYGENEEEYKLHKIIEAAFIAGQKKEQKPVDYAEELEKCKKNPLYFFDKYVKIKMKPAEWSERDEKIIDELITIMDGGTVTSGTLLSEYVAWLKSLRPRPHWKPSEEQMNALNSIILIGSFTYVGQTQDLISLKDDLKKL